MADLAPFPDVELVLADGLADMAAETGSATPPDLANHLPFIRIGRHGGSDDRMSDVARVDIDVFGPSRAVALPLAEAVRQRLLSRPLVTASGVIDQAVTDVAPQELPWEDPKVRRWTASYRITLRRS